MPFGFALEGFASHDTSRKNMATLSDVCEVAQCRNHSIKVWCGALLARHVN